MCDLLLKSGTVVDPSVDLHGVHDIAVQDGKIARIAPMIPREEATRVRGDCPPDHPAVGC